MTEQEWLACTDPTPMLEFLRGKASDRKLRLLTVASCRRIWNLIPSACQSVATQLEFLADGRVSECDYRAAWSEADAASRLCAQDPPNAFTYAAESVMISIPPTTSSVSSALSTAAIAIGCHAAEKTPGEEYDSIVEKESLRTMEEQTSFIRDIFNPFYTISIRSSWFTPTVTDLAAVAYEERALPSGELDPARLAILSDALEEAGCDNADILNHLRSPRPHVRGCWALDALLSHS